MTLFEEGTSGPASSAVTLQVPESTLTAGEIIRRRVLCEVGPHHRGARTVDAEAQIAAARRAFERNGFLMFVGERQIESLDETVELAQDTEVTFLKLIALAGG